MLLLRTVARVRVRHVVMFKGREIKRVVFGSRDTLWVARSALSRTLQ